MELYDDSQGSRGAGPHVDVSPAREERTFKAQLAELVPLRGWRLQRLADALAHNIDRELLEGGANPRDPIARRLVTQKHLQGLADALHAQGPFALEPRPGALLAIRYANRGAFEAYGRLHARLVAAEPRHSPEAVLLREMLQALRLRMLCLDWPSIALVFEGLKHPCDAVALRKRQSRLAALVTADTSSAEDWAIIDAYLKARKRSFGGSSRRIPIGPIVLLLASLAAFGALAAVAWHHFTHAEPVSRVPAPSSAPREPVHPSAVSPKDAPSQPPSIGGQPAQEEKTAGADERPSEPTLPTDDAWWLNDYPVPLVSPPQRINAFPWVVLQSTNRRTLAYVGGESVNQRLIVGSALIDASPEDVEAVLLDFARYRNFMPHVEEAKQLSQTEQGAKLIYERYSWPGVGPVDEVYQERLEHPPAQRSPDGTSASTMTRLEFKSSTSGIWQSDNAKRLSSDDRVVWYLQGRQNNHQTQLQYERTMNLPVNEWPVAQVFEIATNDVPPMLDGLEREVADTARGVGEVHAIELAIKRYYFAPNDFTADFHQSFRYASTQRTASSEGTLQYVKPDLLRWSYTAPHEKLIVFDSRSILEYDSEDNEVFVDRHPTSDSDWAAVPFLRWPGTLEDVFAVSIEHRERAGFVDLELSPKQPMRGVKHVTLIVESPTGAVDGSIVLDEQGNANRFYFRNIRMNQDLSAEQLKFAIPKGATVHDLDAAADGGSPTK